MTAQAHETGHPGYRFFEKYRRPLFRVASPVTLIMNVTLYPARMTCDMVLPSTAEVSERSELPEEAAKNACGGEELFPVPSETGIAFQLYVRYLKRFVIACGIRSLTNECYRDLSTMMSNLGTLFMPAVPIIVETRDIVQVWPRIRRVIIAAAIVATVLCALAWNYTAYKASRAKSLLAEASRVRIGDSEESVLALVQRYGGFKWEPSGSTRTTMSHRPVRQRDPGGLPQSYQQADSRGHHECGRDPPNCS